MKIRSITCFLNPNNKDFIKWMQKAGKMVLQASESFKAADYEVQTTRVATNPFPGIVPNLDVNRVVKFAKDLEGTVKANKFDYLSIGPALPEKPQSYMVIPEILSNTEIVFASGSTTVNGRVSQPAVRACAEIIQSIAGLSPDGFSNLRFAALANVSPGAPFFPAAYHGGDKASFAIATEAADLAVDAFTNAKDLGEARKNLISDIETHAKAVTKICRELEKYSGMHFLGIDLTMAPFPSTARSLGNAIEQIGVPRTGLHGSLSAAAILTTTLDSARFQRTGFCGLMMPVLEDDVLAARAGEGNLTVQDLLLYSAVCGTGLDTIPLPGDVSSGDLAAVLLDVSVLALRLGKPLTARLMPVPGKKAGDRTKFDFPYFANSRVLGLRADGLRDCLAGSGEIEIKAINQSRAIDAA